MNDLELVEQYFLRDLTEAEKKALDELLERSPEAADFFRERAGEVALPRALPELKLPPSLPPPPPKGNPILLSKWLWVLAGYLILAAAYWFLSGNHEFHWPWNQPEQASWSGPAASPLIPASGMETDPALDAEPTPEDESDDYVTPVPVTALSPSGPTGDHQGPLLPRITVTRSIPGLVTVSVLDLSGKEIRKLYAGALQTGQWAFEWNGRLADGDKAPIGTYTLQVTSGSNVQKQEVWIGQ